MSDPDAVIPYPLDPDPASSAETEADLPPPEDSNAQDQLVAVGPAISESDDIDLQPLSAELDAPPEDEPPADVDLPQPTLDGQPRQPPGLAPGAFPVSQAPSQRSPLEGMNGMLGTGQQDVPDFRTQMREVLEPQIREMSFEFMRQMQEELADMSNGMERRHLI